MFIAIDESGNEGFPPTEGQSKWFCLVAVVFARECRPVIEEAFTELFRKLGPQEFHFSDDNRARKLAAIQVMSKLDFSFHMVSCDKSKLQRSGWRPPNPIQKKPILSAMAAALMAKLVIPDDIKRLEVLFDEVGGPKANLDFKKELKSLLRHKVGPHLPMGICAKKSATSPCVQLADYVCGAYMRLIREDNKRNGEYYEWFRNKEVTLTTWP